MPFHKTNIQKVFHFYVFLYDPSNCKFWEISFHIFCIAAPGSYVWFSRSGIGQVGNHLCLRFLVDFFTCLFYLFGRISYFFKMMCLPLEVAATEVGYKLGLLKVVRAKVNERLMSIGNNFIGFEI
jgi:hypothetical protein